MSKIDAPVGDPERIQKIPEFVPYPEPFAYGAIDENTITVQECDDMDTLHVIKHAVFENLITPAIVENFVTATNAYSNFSGSASWKDTDTSEMKALFGVILYLGICRCPFRQMAWSISEGSAKLRGFMSRNRFEQILSAWHYVDLTTLSKQQMEELKQNDPFWASSDFVRHHIASSAV